MAGKERVEEQKQDVAAKNCFVIMPISDVDGYPPGHFDEVYRQLIFPAVTEAGYHCTLATSTSASHMIQLEVVTKVATADLVICDLSTSNPNVLFEYGIRQAFDKPTVLIKDNKTKRIFDLSGFRDIEYDHTLRIASTLKSREEISAAIRDTVEGANDENQIFSLVKMMKLAKAALPTDDVDKGDARFRLLEAKIDGIAEVIVRGNNLKAQSDLNKVRRVTFSENPTMVANRYLINFEADSVHVRDQSKNSMQTFRDFDDMTKADFYYAMSEAERKWFDKNLMDKTDIIPF